MKIIILCFALIFAMSNLAYSQTKIELTKNCLAALENNEIGKAIDAAVSIRSWDYVFSLETGRLGAECLTKVYRQEWVFVQQENQILTSAEATVRESMRKAASKAAEENLRIETELKQARLRAEQDYKINLSLVHEKAYLACVSIYLKDEDVAITNSVCLDEFIRFGLPKQ